MEFYSAKLLLGTHKVMEKIMNPLRSPKHSLMKEGGGGGGGGG